jgi:hypothetical protein
MEGFRSKMIPQWIDEMQENTDSEAKLVEAIKILWKCVEANETNGYAHGHPKLTMNEVEDLGR